MSTESITVTADAEAANLDIPIVAPEVSETTSVSIGGEVDRISVNEDTNPVPTVDNTSGIEDTLTMPEKFANAENPNEALLKAYLELEKYKKGSNEEAEAAPAAEEAETTAEDVVNGEKSETVQEYSKLWAEQGGSLSDEQWESVSKDLNIGVEDLKGYEAYRKEQISGEVNSNDAKIYEVAGGEEAYNKMISWAESNMNNAQLDALNNQLDNPQFSEMGMNMLKQLYTNSVGYEAADTSINERSSQNSTSTDMFHSEAEVREAQTHPQYGKGGKYDMEFDRKLLAYMKAKKQI